MMQNLVIKHLNAEYHIEPVHNPATLQHNDTLLCVVNREYNICVVQRVIKKMGGYRFQMGSDYGGRTYGVISSCDIVGKVIQIRGEK